MSGIRIKRMAVVICVVFTLLSLMTAGLAVHHAFHTCLDEACPVCLCIHRVNDLLKSLSLLWTRILILLSVTGAVLGLSLCSPKLISPTLVKQKIQMNN